MDFTENSADVSSQKHWWQQFWSWRSLPWKSGRPKFPRGIEPTLAPVCGTWNSPLLRKNLTQHIGGAKIYLKREDLNHTGAHKINNALGQVLRLNAWVKRKLSLKRVLVSTVWQTATAAALFNMECTIYMGEEDVKRQALNVFRMELLGS